VGRSIPNSVESKFKLENKDMKI